MSDPSDPMELVVRGSSSSCSSRPLVAQAGYCRESGLVSGQWHCQVPCSTHFPAENWAPATLGLRCRRQRPAHPSLPRPSISLSPTGVIAPGANVTIWCQGPRRYMKHMRYVRFFLHKAGDLNPQQQMGHAWDGAEFRIPSVGRQHGGNYSCSYQPWPFVSSQPSDTVELVVAAAAPGHPDFTHANIARLGLSAMVLLVLGLILAEACYSHPRGAP
ncbi:osteoclast-associated immunoglobulin-like receptor [Mauremys reevesii]|uniref:osteoclast-associated immunoglobulin-like receptor n=1 Tax=Mauremys reevesii TaxID=260615 RepID=UPI00193ED2F1|nr:osteoclast-associated immunoglobulin-like receptor [Mauremys reevesii]